MSDLFLLSSVMLMKLPNFVDQRGGLTVVTENADVPFGIERVFFTYDTHRDVNRGAHAHKTCVQFLMSPHGSLDVEVTDGYETKTFTLNDPSIGLLIPPLIWSVQKNYSKGAICLVLASEKYQENEYLRDFQEFQEFRSGVK
jgi:dTDP-4-dehydrorhamnose 3,5-epimerase-like enzyme